MSNVGDGVTANSSSWTFSGDVVKVFDEHVSKSVPLYNEGHDLICDFSDYFIKTNGIIYELGCSTGELCLKLAAHHKDKPISIIGIDIEADMIEKANEKKKNKNCNLTSFVTSDLIEFDFEPADLIISYYTIQFISPSVRQELIDRIYKSLKWGGALILFEKVRGSDARFQDYLTGVYNEYKLRKGYEPKEIFGKTRSLKGILEPFSSKGNDDMLQRSGFKDIYTIQKYICFEGICAIK